MEHTPYNSMPSPFRSLRQQIFPSYLGVDIGTTSIKVAEVKQGRELPRVVNYGFLESSGHLVRANKVLQTSSLKIFEKEVAELLGLIVSRMKPEGKVALASLPSFTAFMTVLDLPDMKGSELEKAMQFQARQYVPLPVSEMQIDWLNVGEYKDEKGFGHQKVLLIAVPDEQIRKYQAIFKAAGLQLQVLEIESLSLVRSAVGGDATPTIVIDIGSRSTNIAFVDKGQLTFNAQSDFASASLTQALSGALNINPIRAEELKRERGITAVGPTAELSTIMLPFLDVIIGEVKKAQYNYQVQFPTAPAPARAVLSGGGANLPGIERYFQDQLKLPVSKAAPFFRFEYPSEIEPLVPELNPLFSVALGLTLKEFS
jgi:type IV pilus assembly protein PilM